MLKKNPGATTLIPYLLLIAFLLVPFRQAYSHQKDSLLQELSNARKPDQQFNILQQLYEVSCHDNYHEAEKYIMSAVDIALRTSNARYLLLSYKRLAALYEWQKNFMQANIFYQEAQKIAIEEDYPEELPFLNYTIGTVLYRLERYTEAITFLQNACSLANAREQHGLIPQATVYLGMSYHQSDLRKKATILFDSLETAALRSDDKAILSFLYYQLQELYHHLGQHEKALLLNEKAARVFITNNDHLYTIICLKDRARIYSSLDSADLAISCYRKALNEINSAKSFSSLKTVILDQLAACYLNKKETTLGQSYERQSKALKDSLTEKGKTAMMPIQRASYPGILPAKKTSITKLSNWQSRIAPLLLVVMTSLSIIIYRRYKKMQSNISGEKENALVQARQVAEQEKQKALRDAYQLIEEEKQQAVLEAHEIIEKAKEEARSLQAQIATTSVLLANKTDYLTQLQEKLNTTDNADCKRFAKEIKSNIGDNDYWGEFIKNFNLLHSHTIDKITGKHPDLTPNEVKLVCFILSGMNNKEIAGVFSVEPESVKKARYRLKKKLKLTEAESLRSYLDSLQ